MAITFDTDSAERLGSVEWDLCECDKIRTQISDEFSGTRDEEEGELLGDVTFVWSR